MAIYFAFRTPATRNNRLEQVHLHGQGEPDTARFLPVQRIGPKFESWEPLEAAFALDVDQTRFEPGDGVIFKEFVKGPGGGDHTPGIRATTQDLAASSPLPWNLHAIRLLLKSLSDAQRRIPDSAIKRSKPTEPARSTNRKPKVSGL